MSIETLFRLKPGEQYRVYWAKDDDPRDVRLDYEVRTVESNYGDTLTDGTYEWCRQKGLNPKEHILDTSRGFAYFYYP